VIALELALVEPLGRLTRSLGADRITGVQIDSRRIASGDLFVAAGAGAGFAEDALARGAAAALVPADAHVALAAIGAAVRERSAARVVGITGSTGKTSTKDILAALCRPRARTIENEGNYNNELGVPLTLARLEQDTEICIVEMGMRGLGQIAALAAIARPEVAVVTQIAPVHLDLVGTIENVARAKMELVDALPPGGIAVVPDDPILDQFLVRADIEVHRYGTVPELGRFEVRGRTIELRTNFTARHQLQNTLAALTAYDTLGFPFPDELHVDFSAHRGEVRELPGGGMLVDDSYNANPLSMRAALADLAERANGRRRVAVLGAMAELGSDEAAYHREVGAAAFELGIEEVLAVGPLAREYLAVGPRGRWVETAAEAVEALGELLRPGDAVLVKGSRSVGLELVAENLTP